VKTANSTRQRGFNLVETIVASMILSGAVLALGSISTNALVGTRLNQHYQTAASVLEAKLVQVDAMGISEFVEGGETAGVEETLEPGYRWEISTSYQNVDSVYLVSVTVSWMEGSRAYEITGQTMLNGTSTLVPATSGGAGL
jgi:prepilin-type N-terminal cleavage/methylation domain-containing protein